MYSRFVRPETQVLTLDPVEGQPEPDWILVRVRLNEGERRAQYARMVREIDAEGHATIEPGMIGVATILAYLLDWSLVDPQGERVPIADRPPDEVRAIVEKLDPESFEEIRAAITAHEARVAAALAEKKRARNTPPASPGIARSPVVPDGVLT